MTFCKWKNLPRFGQRRVANNRPPAQPAWGRWPGGRLFTTLHALVQCRALRTFCANALHVHNALRLNKDRNRPTLIPEASKNLAQHPKNTIHHKSTISGNANTYTTIKNSNPSNANAHPTTNSLFFTTQVLRRWICKSIILLTRRPIYVASPIWRVCQMVEISAKHILPSII